MRVTSVRQMATSAARPIIVQVMCDFTREVMVVWMSPGSAERREPIIRRISRVPWEGACLRMLIRLEGSGVRGEDVQESSASHLKGILETGLPLWVLLPHALEGGDMIVWVPAHVADSDREPIPHTNYSQLGDGILLKVLCHELRGVSYSKQVPCGAKVFLHHCCGKVDNDNQVAYDAPLQRSGILEQPDIELSVACFHHSTHDCSLTFSSCPPPSSPR